MKAFTKIILQTTRFLRLEPIVIYLSGVFPVLKKCIPHPGLYINEDEIVVKRNSAIFSLNRSDWMQWHIYGDFIDNSWRLAVGQLIQKKNAELVVFDIGSNVGAFTFKLANKLQQIGINDYSIFSFDPNPYVAKRFQKNLKLNKQVNGKISFIQEAMAESVGVATFGFNSENTGTGSLQGHGIEVKKNTLNQFCLENEIHHVDFIKIDVEGFEPFVFDGARKIIERDLPSMYIEISPKMYKRLNRSADEIFKYLFDLNYTIFVDEEKKIKKVDRHSNSELLELEQFNILAIPEIKQ